MKLQQTKEYLLLIDEEAEINLGDYCLFEDKVLRLRTSWSILYKCKIIAYYPLTNNAKELDLLLLPPFEKEIDVEELAKKRLKDDTAKIPDPTTIWLNEIKNYEMYFREGYKASKSRQYTLEEMRTCWEDGYDSSVYDTSKKYGGEWKDNWTFEEFIQSLSTQQLPKEFVLSDKFNTFEENIKHGEYIW